MTNDYLHAFDIYFNVFDNKTADEYYQNVNLRDIKLYTGQPTNNLYISELVVENTNAKKRFKWRGVRIEPL